MKKILILMLSVVFLAACEDDYIDLELKFLEVVKEEDQVYAFYSSDSEGLYYKVLLSSYQYNNWSEDDEENLEVRKDPFLYGSDVLTSLVVDEQFYEAYIDDESIRLYKTDYWE